MTAYLVKTMKFRIEVEDDNDLSQPFSFTFWADYEWDESKNLWECFKSNSGFHERFPDMPYTLTDDDMLTRVIKYS